jgi:hypothetical protein
MGGKNRLARIQRDRQKDGTPPEATSIFWCSTCSGVGYASELCCGRNREWIGWIDGLLVNGIQEEQKNIT